MRRTRRAAAGLAAAGTVAAVGGWLASRPATAQAPPAAAPVRPAFAPEPPAVPSPLTIPAVAVPVPPSQSPPPRPTAAPLSVAQPAGGYVREFAGGESIRLQFDGDRLSVTVQTGPASKEVELYLEADYSASKEGAVYGLITAAEATGGLTDKLPELVGQPFAVQVRVDGDCLSLKDVRCGGASTDELTWVSKLAAGRYTPAGPAPARKPAKPAFTGKRPTAGRLLMPGYPADSAPVPPALPLPPAADGGAVPPPLPPRLPPPAKPADDKNIFHFGSNWFPGQ